MIVLTEAFTALGLALVAIAPAGAAVWLALPLGLALNGTSSLLYASVAELAVKGHEARAFGLYYTLVLGAGAMAPSLFGLVSDMTGIRNVLLLLALLLLVTLPLARGLPEAAITVSPAHAAADAQ